MRHVGIWTIRPVASPEAELLPDEGTARGVQIEIAPDMLSQRPQTLRALPALRDRTTGDYRTDPDVPP